MAIVDLAKYPLNGKPQDFFEEADVMAGWLHKLHGDSPAVELRALKCVESSYRKPHTRCGFFDASHFNEMAKRALVLSRDISPGVYITLNSVNPDLLSRRNNREDVSDRGETANDENITRRVLLLIDIDPKRISDVSSTDDEKAAALAVAEEIRGYLKTLGWPDPIFADSGNGYHLPYRIDLPVDDRIEGDVDTRGIVERCLKALAAKYNTDAVTVDTTVFNPSRIVKLYGTIGRKGDNTPQRPWRRSEILTIPEGFNSNPVPRELLEALAAQSPALTSAKQSRDSVGVPPESFGRASEKLLTRIRQYMANVPGAESGSGGHSATLKAANILVWKFGLTIPEARSILLEWNQTCLPPWDENELVRKLDEALKKPHGVYCELRKEKAKQKKSASKLKAAPAATQIDQAVARDPSKAELTQAAVEHADDPNVYSSGDIEFAIHDATDKPEIDAGLHNLEMVTSQAWAAILAANNPPFLFRFGGNPGRVEHDDHGDPIIRLVEEDRMRHILARVARWTKETGSGDNATIADAMPPKEVVKDVLATPDMMLPVLTRIVEAPVFALDGTLQTDRGYHAASQTFYAPADGFEIPTVSDRPTDAEVAEARSLICADLLVDFPFTDGAEKSHAIALLLLPFARDLIPGATPLHLFEKPSPGTGATLLVDMLSYPATGHPISTMTEGRDEDEWRKRLTAKLRNTPTFLLIDNLRRRLDSGAVSAAITSPMWEDRILGQSIVLKIHVRCCWLATGNNPAVSSEMSRRIIRVRLDAKMDRPWLRTGFKHSDLRGWARQNRGRLVWAALTLIRAWIVAGRPRGGQKLGMFEEWSEVMGGILDIAGIPGFLSNLDEFYNDSDAEGGHWRSLVAAWWDAHRDGSVKVADLFKLIGDDVVLPPCRWATAQTRAEG